MLRSAIAAPLFSSAACSATFNWRAVHTESQRVTAAGERAVVSKGESE